MHTVSRRSQQGLSLIELMITIVIGLIIIGATMGVYIGILGANSTQIKVSHVNNELRTAMTFITRDLRRAGYFKWSVAQLVAGNFLTTQKGGQSDVSYDGTNTTFAIDYDLNSAGTYNSTSDSFGFRRSGNAIQGRVGTSWGNITDPNVVNVSALTVTDLSPGAITINGRTTAIKAYRVTITAQHKADTSITRTLEEIIQVRNIVAN